MQLSKREQQFAALIQAGLDTRQIADKLGVEPSLVHRYRAILRKKGISEPRPDYGPYGFLEDYPLTKKEIRFAIVVLKTIEAGKTIADAADELDVLEADVATMASIIRSKGVPLPKFTPRKRENNDARVDALAKKGLTVSTISDMTGLSPNLISQILRKLRMKYPEDQVPEYLWPMDAGGRRRKEFIGRKLKPRQPIDTKDNQPTYSESNMTNPTRMLAEGLRKVNEASKCADKVTPIDGSAKMKKGKAGKPKATPPSPPTQSEATAAAVLAILGEDSVKSIHEAQRAVGMIEDFAESHDLNFDSVVDNFVRWGERRGYENIPATRELVKQWVNEVFGGHSWNGYEKEMNKKAEREGDPSIAANAKKYRDENEPTMKRSGIKFDSNGKAKPAILGPKGAKVFNKKKVK